MFVVRQGKNSVRTLIFQSSAISEGKWVGPDQTSTFVFEYQLRNTVCD